MPDPAIEHKTRENRSRREARRQGLELVKARSEEPGWLLLHPEAGTIVSGVLLLSLDDVERFLGGHRLMVLAEQLEQRSDRT